MDCFDLSACQLQYRHWGNYPFICPLNGRDFEDANSCMLEIPETHAKCLQLGPMQQQWLHASCIHRYVPGLGLLTRSSTTKTSSSKYPLLHVVQSARVRETPSVCTVCACITRASHAFAAPKHQSLLANRHASRQASYLVVRRITLGAERTNRPPSPLQTMPCGAIKPDIQPDVFHWHI